MKKIAVVLLCLAVSAAAGAQDLNLKKNARINVIVNNIVMANSEMEKIIGKYNLVINTANINNSARTGDYQVFASDENLFAVIAEIERLGLTDLKEIKSINFTAAVESTTFDLEHLKKQKEIYGGELSLMNKSDESYNELFAKERDLDERIYGTEKEIRDLVTGTRYSVVSVKLSERKIQDLDSRDEFGGFINMPGAETKILVFENSDDPALSSAYVGGSLRYMFTKGRMYALIGVMKPVEKGSGDDAVSDIVTYSFGKDFYPRYFGQGRNTFFNPFSGLEIGGLILTSKNDTQHMAFLEPHIGVEIFKNKYVIVDTRVGYVFPLDEEFIKSRRGLTANLSINFVF